MKLIKILCERNSSFLTQFILTFTLFLMIITASGGLTKISNKIEKKFHRNLAEKVQS